MTRNLDAAFALLMTAALLAGCGGKPPAPPPRPVKAQAVERLLSVAGSRYSASIAPGTQIELAFKVGGYVASVRQVRGVDGGMRRVQAGDFVNRGAVLASVRQSDYQIKVDQARSTSAEAQSGVEVSVAQSAQAQQAIETAKAQLAEAEAAHGRARLEFDRAQTLFDSQSLTKSDYDAAKAQNEVAEARVRAARSQVRTAEAAARVARAQVGAMQERIKGSRARISEAQLPLNDTALRAPLDGIILRRDVEVGSLVAPGRPGFVLADVSTVKATFGVPDRVVASLSLGRPLTVTSEAVPGSLFHGRITAIAPAADAKSRVFDVEITIPNADNALKVGMVVSIEVQEGPPPADALAVPLNAVVQSKTQPDGYAVFVLEAQGSRQLARMRNVRLGDAYGNTVAVVEGVNAGEQVITIGASLLTDGEQVVVIP
jgi:multidrug efflux system membrane fusion protein